MKLAAPRPVTSVYLFEALGAGTGPPGDGGVRLEMGPDLGSGAQPRKIFTVFGRFSSKIDIPHDLPHLVG